MRSYVFRVKVGKRWKDGIESFDWEELNVVAKDATEAIEKATSRFAKTEFLASVEKICEVHIF